MGDLTARLSSAYPYTEWKGIDWNGLATKYTARLDAAWAKSDYRAYYAAALDLLTDISDGHCYFQWDDSSEQDAVCETNNGVPKAVKDATIGGGYGVAFAVADVAGGNKEVVVVASTNANVAVGDILVAVCDDISCSTETDPFAYTPATPPRYADPVPATAAHKLTEKVRFLSRGPVGHKMYWKLKPRAPAAGAVTLSTIEVTADGSETATLLDTQPYAMPSPRPASCVTHRVIPASGDTPAHGYLQVGSFTGCVGLPDAIKAALSEFKNVAKVSSLIVDMRGNGGGDDNLVPALLSYFYDADYMLETTAVLQPFASLYPSAYPGTPNAAGFVRAADGGESVVRPAPADDRWTGEIVVLVNRAVMSNGDMASFGLKRLPGTKVVGLEGTSGSVSMAGENNILVPCLMMGHTLAQSWDADGKVQLEANKEGLGGVLPTHPVPRTPENLALAATFLADRGQVDVVLRHAQSLLKKADTGTGTGTGTGTSTGTSTGTGTGAGTGAGTGTGTDSPADKLSGAEQRALSLLVLLSTVFAAWSVAAQR